MQFDDRYRKQTLVPQFGPEGQPTSPLQHHYRRMRRPWLTQAMLGQSGAGHLILIDRDVVETGNLHRQML